MALHLESSEFEEGEPIPRRFTCDGEDVSPPLAWHGVPQGTRSLALVCDDPDAPNGTWYHWAVFDIPPETVALDEGFSADESVGRLRQGVNDFGRIGYGGPCPPRGHGAHRYNFRLLALSSERLGLVMRPRCAEVLQQARAHLVEETVLTGTYER